MLHVKKEEKLFFSVHDLYVKRNGCSLRFYSTGRLDYWSATEDVTVVRLFQKYLYSFESAKTSTLWASILDRLASKTTKPQNPGLNALDDVGVVISLPNQGGFC